MSTGIKESVICLATALGANGGTDDLSQSFADQELVDTLLCVMDFHYDGADGKRQFFLDLVEVLAEAGESDDSVFEHLHAWLDPLMDVHAEEIEAVYATA